MLDDLLHRKAITAVVNHSGQLLHHFRSEVGAWKFDTVEIFLLEKGVQCEHLLDEDRDLGILDHRLDIL